MARRYGATEEELATLHDLDRCPVPESERAALRFAETMTREPRGLDASAIEALREHWSDDQIVELTCVVGLFNYLNRFAEAMGLQPTAPGEGGPDDPENHV